MFPVGAFRDQIVPHYVKLHFSRDVDRHMATIGALVATTQSDKSLEQLAVDLSAEALAVADGSGCPDRDWPPPFVLWSSWRALQPDDGVVRIVGPLGHWGRHGSHC
jgi:hypothetical protein